MNARCGDRVCRSCNGGRGDRDHTEELGMLAVAVLTLGIALLFLYGRATAQDDQRAHDAREKGESNGSESAAESSGKH